MTWTYKIRFMSTKELALETIRQLPEDATWEDIQEKIRFMAGVRKGLEELDKGQGIPHEEVKQKLKSRVSK